MVFFFFYFDIFCVCISVHLFTNLFQNSFIIHHKRRRTFRKTSVYKKNKNVCKKRVYTGVCVHTHTYGHVYRRKKEKLWGAVSWKMQRLCVYVRMYRYTCQKRESPIHNSLMKMENGTFTHKNFIIDRTLPFLVHIYSPIRTHTHIHS